jgi:alpha-glucosidase
MKRQAHRRRGADTIRAMTATTTAGSHSPDLRSVHHDGSGRYVRPIPPARYDRLRVGDEVTLRMRAARGARIERVLLRTSPDGEQLFTEMSERAGDACCRWWETTVRLTEPVVGYRFLVLTTDGIMWLNGTGLHEDTPLDVADFRLLAGYSAPGWLEKTVIYEIFPDRFAGSGVGTDALVAHARSLGLPAVRRQWAQPPARGREARFEFYGGDLPGIESRLDYIESLGIGAIYVTPIFEALSNHGYDSIDYEHVAAHFGGDVALTSLRAATRSRGIRLILDIAPNHVGVGHPWFRDAQADSGAPTAEFFSFLSHPDEYETWLGRKSLVKLDYRSAALRQAIYAGPDAIMRRWLREPYGIDGWRIDVANMLGRLGPSQISPEVARGIREAVREENPQAFLVGENWFDATSQLMGDQWDAAMDYAGFTTPLLEWLSGVELHSPLPMAPVAAPSISTGAFAATLASFRTAVPWIIARQQMLLLGSHDTARVKTVVQGDPALLRLAFGLLLTYPGVPCIYYGDEIGLEAEGSLAARATMPWNEAAWDEALLAFVRSLVGFRRTLPALVHGGFQLLDVGPDWFAYLRDTDEDVAIVIANRGPGLLPTGQLELCHAGISDGQELSDLVSGSNATVAEATLSLPEMSPGVAIWYGRRS